MTNETNEEKSRADAMTDERRMALGSLITEWFGKQDDGGRLLAAFDYCDSRAIDLLIDEAIAPAIADAVQVARAASPVEQHEAAPADVNQLLEAAALGLERAGMLDCMRIVRGMKPGYPKQRAPAAPLEGTGNGADGFTYATKQATACAACGEHKHTPLRIDWMGGYVCLTCIDRELVSRAPRTEVAGAVPQPIGPHDVTTSAGGRGYIAEFFAKRLCRHDFGRYIDERLAADFACALAKYLMEHDTSPSVDAAAAPADHISRTGKLVDAAARDDERADALQDMAFAHGLQLGWQFGSNDARADYEAALKARDGYVKVLRDTRAAASQPAAELTPREISALRELKKLGEHRYFAIRSAIAEAWPIVERLTSRTPPAQSAAAAGQEAVAWVRKHPDTGELSGDWLWNDVIEQCRKDSGVWFPLGFLTAPPAQVATRQGLTDEQIIECAGKYRIDHYGDYSRNASEHTRDLLAFAHALLDGAKQ
ncbi:hypothetical protein [Burkholderia pseudomallei]|uniref:hypothetical protein n=1 Tax=Burkholderia pseudomallei TaxID=28450 RepID=UPI000A1A07D3|nr:hypothetical protein [Burkholderia pseudomallei]ARK91105.1 hypothetical protein BOC42_28175 [Burkholderia pseudomallei]